MDDSPDPRHKPLAPNSEPIMPQIAIVRTVADLRAQVAAWKQAGERVALVPTMGALHDGHLSLIALAKTKADRVVASVFVNPTQFGPNEDFDAYPRDEARDADLLAGAGCDLLFAPTVAEMYAPGFATTVSVTGVSEPLDGAARPGHFAGVATVVSKLLIQCGPDVAVFGEKDYQQLKVVTRMAADLDLGIKIVPLATIREVDGLAMSSRNVYLSPDERVRAAAMYRALNHAADKIRAGEVVGHEMTEAREILVEAGFVVDYIEARHAETLERIARRIEGPIRLLAAAKIGQTRLIDNIAV